MRFTSARAIFPEAFTLYGRPFRLGRNPARSKFVPHLRVRGRRRCLVPSGIAADAPPGAKRAQAIVGFGRE